MEKSLEIAELYVRAGCDAIEWSLPPKDPYVDPPYIAEKMQKAREQPAFPGKAPESFPGTEVR